MSTGMEALDFTYAQRRAAILGACYVYFKNDIGPSRMLKSGH